MTIIKKLAHSLTYALLEGWSFEYKEKSYPASVPGDITTDLLANKLIEDPSYDENYKKIDWVFEQDWTYRLHLEITKEDFARPVVSLSFAMVDTFADIYVNDVLVGKTDSMFHPFTFDIKKAIKLGSNEVRVVLHSIRQAMRDLHNTKYKASFNNDRPLIRKAQCHFGWDWAPDFPGTGIAGDVTLYCGDGYLLDNVFPQAELDGRVGFIVETIKNNRYPGEWEETKGFSIRLSVSKKPGELGKDCYQLQRPLFGQKNLLNVTIQNPELWYPNGYGAQPLYAYKAELLNEKGEVLDVQTGHFGIRKIEVDQSPVGEDRRYFRFIVNGEPIRVLGSNWVPAMATTGAIEEGRYQKLLVDAQEAGFSMLRVWGGGIYEKDIFYDLCDQLGILVWQDFMFSCQFIPDDTEAFRAIVQVEAIAQIKRLRNRTCLAIYTGGNELGNAFVVDRKQKMSDYSQFILLAGLVHHYDGTHPYLWDCPCALSDVGNDFTSGDSHYSPTEDIIGGMDLSKFREAEQGHETMFVSEGAAMGLCRLRSFRKFMPNEKLWPPNEVWEERMAGNPYAAVSSFTQRHEIGVTSLFGGASGIEDFVKKSMMVHAELLRSQLEFARAYPYNSGFMNWMYNDIWGTGTWSLVDYYFDKKPAYYAMKRSGARQAVEILLYENKTMAVVINDTEKPWKGTLVVRQELVDGAGLLKEIKKAITLAPFSQISIPLSLEEATDPAYLYATFDGKDCVYFYDLWADKKFETSLKITKEIEKTNTQVKVTLHVEALKFARVVFISLPEGVEANISDNYFDLPEGRSKDVVLQGDKSLREEDVRVLTYADSWEE